MGIVVYAFSSISLPLYSPSPGKPNSFDLQGDEARVGRILFFSSMLKPRK